MLKQDSWCYITKQAIALPSKLGLDSWNKKRKEKKRKEKKRKEKKKKPEKERDRNKSNNNKK